MKNSMLLLAILLIAVAGCNTKKDESLAKQAGSAVGEGLTDFASGVGKGVNKQMTVKVELSKALVDAGLSSTVAKPTGISDIAQPPEKRHSSGKGISIYLVASKPFKSKLVAKALNKEGQEIGRATAEVDFAEDDAKYIAFSFEHEMDRQLVDKYLISAKK